MSDPQPVIRPARPSDIDAFLRLALAVGDGMTSMPPDEAILFQRLTASETRLAAGAEEILPDGIWLVLEAGDLEAGDNVLGTSAIFPAIGLDWPFYSFRRNRLSNRSLALGKSLTIETLTLTNDLCGMAEVGGLVVHPDARKGGAGRLVAQARYMFMACHRSWFPNKVVAEMRGYLDDHGRSPVWEALGRPFYDMDFVEADRFGALNGNQFIAELGPRHAIYLDLLPPDVRECVGKAHVESALALRMLLQEGFEAIGYCDIFDGGPQVIAEIDRLKLVQNRRSALVRNITPDLPDGMPTLIATGQRLDFRMTKGSVRHNNGEVDITSSTASALQVGIGQEIHLA